MISKKYRLALAKMLKLYKEISTEQGNLVAEAEEIVVGTEVFVDGEEGMVPAQDGEYIDTVNNLIYVVTGGTVTEIKEKENTLEGNLKDNQEKGSDNGEGNQEENNEGSQDGTGDDNGSQNGTGDTGKMEDNAEMDALKGENEALKAKVAELEATVSDLEDQIAAYKAKEEETAPSAEDAEKFSKQGTGDKALDKKMKAAQAIKSVYNK